MYHKWSCLSSVHGWHNRVYIPLSFIKSCYIMWQARTAHSVTTEFVWIVFFCGLQNFYFKITGDMVLYFSSLKFGTHCANVWLKDWHLSIRIQFWTKYLPSICGFLLGFRMFSSKLSMVCITVCRIFSK